MCEKCESFNLKEYVWISEVWTEGLNIKLSQKKKIKKEEERLNIMGCD